MLTCACPGSLKLVKVNHGALLFVADPAAGTPATAGTLAANMHERELHGGRTCMASLQ